jgi:hypothetical protein
MANISKDKISSISKAYPIYMNEDRSKKATTATSGSIRRHTLDPFCDYILARARKGQQSQKIMKPKDDIYENF